MANPSIKDEILSLKPCSDEVLSLTATMDLRRGENCIFITRYFKLYNNSRSWSIEGSRRIDNWDSVMNDVKELKAEINEYRKIMSENWNTAGLHGLTFYVD